MSGSSGESNEDAPDEALADEKAAAGEGEAAGAGATGGESALAEPDAEELAGEEGPGEDLPEAEGEKLVEEPLEAPKPSPVGLRNAWEKVRSRYEARLHQLGRKPAGLSRYVKGAREFIEWAIQHGYSPESASADWKQVFTAHVDSLGAARITKNVNRLAGIGMIEEAMANPEEQMEEYDDAPEGETEEADEVDEPQVKQTRRTNFASGQPQVVFVQAPAKAPRQPKAAAQPRASRLFKSEQVRIYKRNFAGKKVYIGDYDVSDIGTSLHRFIKDFVDNDFHEPSGRTTYEAFQIGADGKELGSPASVAIESGAEPPPDDEMQKARSAVELIRDLRELDDEKLRGRQELLNEAQKKAVSSGDMTQLMMLMMMQNMQQPRNEVDVASRVLEHLKSSGKAHEVFPIPPPPPLPMPIAPIQPPDDPLRPAMAEVLKQAVQPRPEKSTMEFAKELAAIKELFAQPKQDDPEMKLLLKTLVEKMAQPPQQSGLDAIVSQFGKIKEVVTTLAPQVNAGGLVGALQSIITPQLGAALGNVIAAGLEKSKAFQPPGSSPAVPSAPAAAPKSAGPSPQVAAAITAFRAASDEPGQVVTAYQLMGALYDDVAYKAKMEPALMALMQQKTEPAVKLALELLREIRPDLANERFAKLVVAHLIRSNGGTPPAELGAEPVEAKPEPAPVVPREPREPREPPVPKQGELLRDKEPDVVVAPVGPKQGEALRDKDEPANGEAKVTELPVQQPAPTTAVA